MTYPSLQSDSGLTTAEVTERIAAGQVNRLRPDGWQIYADILRRNTLTLFNLLVVPAGVALFLLGDFRGAWAVSAMAVANTLIGLTHELRAKWHLDQLSLLGETRVRVRRNGVEQNIPSGEVVREDRILIGAGDTIVADGRIISAAFLELDEALLTGESDPVPRTVGEKVKSGSVCVAGEGIYLAEQVGENAFAQQTAVAARKYRHAPGPTQDTLNRLVQWLTALAVALCLGYVILFFVRGFPATDLVQMVAATITSMVPQGLVLLTTLVFVLAAAKLSKRGAIIQRLMAVEGLAAVDVLCTDKTGTLTTGRQKLDHMLVFSEPEPGVRHFLGIFAAVSIDQRNKSIEALREVIPVDASLVEILDQMPFQSQNRCSAVIVRIDHGKPRLLVFGSFEVLATRFPEAEKTAIESAWRELLPSGMRMLVFADGVAGNEPFRGQLPLGDLRPLALVVLRDELRPGVADVLGALAAQGIRFKVVSGDHPETVRATVRSLGKVFADQSIMTGDEWIASDNRVKLAENCNLFGRVSPEQKLALVMALQRGGRNVGMIGDGVNDILPIKRADFGVAMGAGSPATKTVAGLVIESNDFAVLPEVLTEGRRVVRNVRCAAKLFLLKNIYTVVLILVAVGVAGLPFPYLPQQVTLLNALTIGVPAILILTGRSRSSRPVDTDFFADVGQFLMVAGISTSAAALVVYLGACYRFPNENELARTLLLSTLIVAGVGNACVATLGDWSLIAWAIVAVIGFMIGSAIPGLAYFFALSPLNASHWLGVFTAGGLAVLASARFSVVWDRSGENRPSGAGDRRPDGPKDSAQSLPPG